MTSRMVALWENKPCVFVNLFKLFKNSLYFRGCRGRYRMLVGFTTTYAINANHH
jgi:hypothetical protein